MKRILWSVAGLLILDFSLVQGVPAVGIDRPLIGQQRRSEWLLSRIKQHPWLVMTGGAVGVAAATYGVVKFLQARRASAALVPPTTFYVSSSNASETDQVDYQMPELPLFHLQRRNLSGPLLLNPALPIWSVPLLNLGPVPPHINLSVWIPSDSELFRYLPDAVPSELNSVAENKLALVPIGPVRTVIDGEMLLKLYRKSTELKSGFSPRDPSNRLDKKIIFSALNLFDREKPLVKTAIPVNLLSLIESWNKPLQKKQIQKFLRFPCVPASGKKYKAYSGYKNCAEGVIYATRKPGACSVGVQRKIEDRDVFYRLKGPGAEEVSIAAIFDGHGGSGVSDILVKKFVPELARQLVNFLIKNPSSSNSQIKDLIQKGFALCDEELRKRKDLFVQGSTASLVIVLDKRIFVVTLGDSRVLVGFKDPEADLLMSSDHSLGREDERKRVEAEGGKVSDDRLCCSEDCWLGVSRAFGDFLVDGSKPKGLSVIPEIFVLSKDEVEFIVGGSDGFWVSMDDNESMNDDGEVNNFFQMDELMRQVVSRDVEGKETCEACVEAAADWWYHFDEEEDGDGYRDDITLFMFFPNL